MGLIDYVVKGRGTSFMAPTTPLKICRLLLKNLKPFIILQTAVPKNDTNTVKTIEQLICAWLR